MGNIKTGEYIKDKEGNITKICNILNLDRGMYLYVGEDGFQYSDNGIVGHSKRLIDLLEVDEYDRNLTDKLLNDFEDKTILTEEHLPVYYTK